MNPNAFIPNTAIEKYFYEISQIPRSSYNEKAISNYLVEFAEKHDLWVLQDDVLNVIIRKPASQGYESEEPVILQAHMDMVCVKASQSTHDFETDPLQLYVEEGKLRAKDTSLGGDDGYGLAFMLAILEDKSLKHPELECVFTVQEEVNMLGATHLDTSILKGKRMINLDGDQEYSTYVSSYCSDRITLKQQYGIQRLEGNYCTIIIDDMEGSSLHGAVHQECCNAIKIMARLIQKLFGNKAIICLNEFAGGKADNANPLYCKATFSYQGLTFEEINNIVEEEFKHVFDEFENDQYKGKVKVLKVETNNQVSSRKDTEDFINLLTVFPNNLFQYDIHDKNVISINNLGLTSFKGGQIKLTASSRSKYFHSEEQLINFCKVISKLAGYEMITEVRYRPWRYNPDSSLRSLANDIIFKNSGKKLSESICPGGLEIAIFTSKIKDLDVLSLGIQGEGLHSVHEAFSLESFNRRYQVLVQILKELKYN